MPLEAAADACRRTGYVIVKTNVKHNICDSSSRGDLISL
jgi:hypothetical protein